MKRFLLLVLPLIAALYVSAQTNHNGTWYSYYDDNTHTMNTQGDYEHGDVFAPTTGTLNVQWKYEWVDWVGFAKKIDTDVLESANNGDNTTEIGSFAENTDKNSNTTESFSISENIAKGYLQDTGDSVRLTDKGLDFANLVFADFL